MEGPTFRIPDRDLLLVLLDDDDLWELAGLEHVWERCRHDLEMAEEVVDVYMLVVLNRMEGAAERYDLVRLLCRESDGRRSWVEASVLEIEVWHLMWYD